MIRHSKLVRSSALLSCAFLLSGLVSAGSLLTPTKAEAAGVRNVAQYRAWMTEAKKLYPYPQSVDKMYRVMMCESSGNPRASGGRGAWLGLFQYAPRTWRGSWNPYRNSSIWDAKS